MSSETFDLPLEVKFLCETGLFEGYASVFNVTDSVNDKIAAGAFAQSLQDFSRQGRLPPLLWQHDGRQPIGAWREIREDSYGLYVKGDLFVDDIPRAREAWKLMREGVVTGLSIGYRVRQSYRDEKSDARILTDIDLLEISMVTFPANDQARVHALRPSRDACRAKAGQPLAALPSEKEFEVFLREAGLSRKQAKGVIAVGYKGLLPCDAERSLRDDQEMSDAQALQYLTGLLRDLT